MNYTDIKTQILMKQQQQNINNQQQNINNQQQNINNQEYIKELGSVFWFEARN